ncbi:MAG: hypothetical protein PHD32_01270 [Eubacteriales bacterium]|nr:hypothetical protein [Eubacteriales bacterium]
MIRTYDELCRAVAEYGFLFLSDPGGGVPSLSALTAGNAWHTGDAQTDPWCWKNRYAAGHDGAYGALLRKSQAFISGEMLPAFFALRRWEASREALYEAGELSTAENLVWQAVERFTVLDTVRLHEIARSQDISPGRCDGALKNLQEHFVISLTGSTRRRNAKGEPYGWSVGVYEMSQSWLQPFLKKVPGCREAADRVLRAGRRAAPTLSDARLAALLDLPAQYCNDGKESK